MLWMILFNASLLARARKGVTRGLQYAPLKMRVEYNKMRVGKHHKYAQLKEPIYFVHCRCYPRSIAINSDYPHIIHFNLIIYITCLKTYPSKQNEDHQHAAKAEAVLQKVTSAHQ